jgi:hypothetical protein
MSFGELGDKAASVWRPLWLAEGRVTAAEVRPSPPNFPKVSKTKQRRDCDGFKMAVIHRKRSAMCEECEKLQGKITHYRQFLKQRFDPLTEERMKQVIADLERRKKVMHQGESLHA